MSAEPTLPTTPGGAGLRQRRISSSQKAKLRDERVVAAAVAGEAPTLALLFHKATPAINIGIQAVNIVGPTYAKAFALGVWAYNNAPVDVIQAATGLGLCFFGGAYNASIAAIEAFHLATYSTTRAALEDIYEDVVLIREAHEEDEKKKDAGDASKGTPAEIAQRKLRVALLAVRDPQKLSIAVGGLYAGWLAVVGTLRLRFARTVTLGVSIAEMLDAPALRFGTPVLAHVVPPEYHLWLPVAIRTTAKAIAVTFAWYLQVRTTAHAVPAAKPRL